MLLVQSLCVQCFKKSKLKTSVSGVRKGLLIDKLSTEDGSPSGTSKPS